MVEDVKPSLIDLDPEKKGNKGEPVVKETEKAYLAGLLDGEGTVSILRTKGGKGVETIIASIEVSNTDIRMIQWMKDLFGGNVVLSNRKRTRDGKWKPLYRIAYRGRSVDRILNLALPYLKLKVRQAQLALELRSRMGAVKERPLPSREWVYREALLKECKSLNARGTQDAERLSEKALEIIRVMRQSELAGNEPREEAPKSLPAAE